MGIRRSTPTVVTTFHPAFPITLHPPALRSFGEREMEGTPVQICVRVQTTTAPQGDAPKRRLTAAKRNGTSSPE